MSKKFSLSPARPRLSKNFPPARPLQEKNLRAGQTPTPQISKEGSPRYIHTVLHTRLAKFKSGGGGYIFGQDVAVGIYANTPRQGDPKINLHGLYFFCYSSPVGEVVQSRKACGRTTDPTSRLFFGALYRYEHAHYA